MKSPNRMGALTQLSTYTDTFSVKKTLRFNALMSMRKCGSAHA